MEWTIGQKSQQNYDKILRFISVPANNAEKDGTTTSILLSINYRGLRKRKNNSLNSTGIMVIDGKTSRRIL
jgi:hypothetical protein